MHTTERHPGIYSILCHGYINVPAARSAKKAEMSRASVVLSKISYTKIIKNCYDSIVPPKLSTLSPF